MPDAQQELDDEILSACHDGELPATEADAVRRRLQREPQLADRLHAIQYVDTAAAEAFRARDRQALPEQVLELLQSAEREYREREFEIATEAHSQGPCVQEHRRWSAALVMAIASALRRIRARTSGQRRMP